MSFFHTEIITLFALASRGTIHNGNLIVLTFEIVIFTKNNIFIYIFFQRIYSHNSQVHNLDKPSDAPYNLSQAF